ncbi:enoyl-CoA hydratase/isomerase family protein [Noviherbaspirillum pedocola]|uniref:Enoyl-CoA hydratase/isomerase family protein n=1 Tax=Noviherbaspirillum pedocola TaxID=2801341 RepID=A0A934T464_9BURK|nr:enoyl-CoA hydratase/isomerase family protein [Noviherbaspirillum pedocola]MBK4738728.1 enoyl-CoA hydratase/isomerase family protein [Noviherbaspirillum pedocola]
MNDARKYQTIKVEKRGATDWVTLDRPEQLNTLNHCMIDELLHYFGERTFDLDTRAIVLRGAGRAYCAGLDLADSDGGDRAFEPSPGSPTIMLRLQRRISEIVMRMRRVPQPIVSLVHGPACGGGFALALASDVRIAGQSAKMNAAFIRIGLSACDIGVSYFLPRLVGVSVASELMLTGRFIRAERAERVGLVSEVCPDAELEQAGMRLVEEMLDTAPLGLRLTKDCLNHSVNAASLDAAIAMEDRNQVLCAQTEDFREGVQAFMKKRAPSYSGR